MCSQRVDSNLDKDNVAWEVVVRLWPLMWSRGQTAVAEEQNAPESEGETPDNKDEIHKEASSRDPCDLQ